MQTQTTTTASAQETRTKEVALLPIRLQDINRINSYLQQCGITPTQYKIALQHCKEIIGQFNMPESQAIYNILDQEIGFVGSENETKNQMLRQLAAWWARDDRKWNTQQTVEQNLIAFVENYINSVKP